MRLTRVIALKDAGQTDEVYGHSELRISFDIKWLFSGQARRESGGGVLATS